MLYKKVSFKWNKYYVRGIVQRIIGQLLVVRLNPECGGQLVSVCRDDVSII